MCEIVKVSTAEQLEHVRFLFAEYGAQLPFELCGSSLETEIAGLPGEYGAPKGELLLALVVGQPVGCVGLRPFPSENTCEMKRLYVRPTFRGGKIGKKLVERLIDDARQLDYSAIRLDSHPATMGAAVAMYRAMGFREVSAAPLHPINELIYMELALR